MTRSFEERIADVRRLLDVATQIHAERSKLATDVARFTGLSPEGVELGFSSLERDATDDDLEALVDAAMDARHVHVVLSANVFVAALRAIALAWAAAPIVTVRPSTRDPVIARELVKRLAEPRVTLVQERDVGASGADKVHVYGRAESIAAVRAEARPGVRVVGHGPGMGIAVVSAEADLERAAEALALDVAAFDQRGCLSPRVAFVRGDDSRAEAFAEALHGALGAVGSRIPRGVLTEDEKIESRRWMDVVSFAGHVLEGGSHVVAKLPTAALATLPPAGRHIAVVPCPTEASLASQMAAFTGFIVAIGSDDGAGVPFSNARQLPLGSMQRPPLDGPVDRRTRT